jgi:hypothetical protein
MPAAGAQAAEEARFGGLFIEVEILRVEAAGEVFDLAGGEGVALAWGMALALDANAEIFPKKLWCQLAAFAGFYVCMRSFPPPAFSR